MQHFHFEESRYHLIQNLCRISYTTLLYVQMLIMKLSSLYSMTGVFDLRNNC